MKATQGLNDLEGHIPHLGPIEKRRLHNCLVHDHHLLTFAPDDPGDPETILSSMKLDDGIVKSHWKLLASQEPLEASC
jgi:hypothetical protein